uniref:Uncharacterized protein n=1 Tax=Arundo donax TaxID=35708 RepID=A0A0A9EAZ4_ARUDO
MEHILWFTSCAPLLED